MVALRTFAGVVAFLALLQVLPISAGVLGLPLSQTLAIAMVVAALVTAVAFARRFPAAVPEPAPPGERRVGRVLGLLVPLTLAWAIMVWGLLWVLAWRRSPAGWDELWYHIPAINDWVLGGGVGFHPLDPALARVPLEVQLAGWLNFPMGVELTGFMLHQLTGSDRLIDAANLLYWPLAATALVVIAARLGARGRWPWLAGGLLFGVSLYVMQSATLYVDTGFASGTIAAIAATLVFALDRDLPRWPAAVLFGAAVGLMLGAKGVGAPFTVVLLGAAAVASLAARGWRAWRRQLVSLAVAASVAGLVGGYWYARNAVHAGNPIYPFQIQLGHKVLVQGYDLTGYDRLDWVVRPVVKPYPPWARTFAAWLQRDLPIFDAAQRGNYALAGGLGFVWLVGGIPAAIYLVLRAGRRPRPAQAGAVLLLVGMVLALYLTTTIPWQARFTFWLHALGLPAMAVALSDAAERWRRQPAYLLAVGLGIGAIGVALWESAATLRSEWQVGRSQGAAGSGFLSSVEQRWPGMSEAPGFRELLASDPIARSPWQSTGGTLATGVLAMPLGRRVVVLPPEPDAEQLRQLGLEGVEWVFWEVRNGTELPPALQERATETHKYERYGDYDFYAVRLPLPGGDAPEVTLHGMDQR